MRRSPSAFTIIEVTVAVMLLAVALGTLAPLVRLLQLAQRESARHRHALQVADNLLERVLMLDWQELHADLPDDKIRAEELVASLPGAKWNLSVVESTDPVTVKRVTLTVSYTTHGQPESVHVTAWAYRDSAAGPAFQPAARDLNESPTIRGPHNITLSTALNASTRRQGD